MKLNRWYSAACRLVALCALALDTIGCSKSGPKTAPVSGIVTCNGKPVQHAMVAFFPQNVAEAKVGMTRTDAEGRFRDATTFQGADGVVVGHHFVTVTDAWPPGADIPTFPDGMLKPPPRGPWNNKYRDSSGGALQVDVLADKDNQFEFDLSK